MATRTYITWEDGYKRRPSNTDTVDFSSIRIGASLLEIKETAGHFDFSAKKLVNVAPGGVSGEAVEYGQYNTALGLKEDTANRGSANGYCPLDASSKVPAVNLPNAIMEYKGTWNATTNTPTLADGGGNADEAIGDVYRVSVSGTQDLGSGSIDFDVGDYVILNASKVWERSPGGDNVDSVNGQSGVVVLDTDDIGEGSTNKYYSETLFNSSFSGKSTDDLTEGSTNKYYSETLFNSSFSGKTTTDLTEGDNKYYTAAQARSDLITQVITDGVTGTAPSEDAVYDALALKAAADHNHDGVYSPVGHDHSGVYAPISHNHTASDVTDFSAAAKAATISQVITDGVTGLAPSEDAVFDALALKADLTDVSAPKTTLTNKEGGEITIRQVCYLTAAGEVNLAQANDSLSLATAFYMVEDASIANDASGEFYMPDRGTEVDGFSGLTVGSPIYLSRSSAGGYQQDLSGFVAGEHVVTLGRVVSATKIVWNPKYEFEW